MNEQYLKIKREYNEYTKECMKDGIPYLSWVNWLSCYCIKNGVNEEELFR